MGGGGGGTRALFNCQNLYVFFSSIGIGVKVARIYACIIPDSARISPDIRPHFYIGMWGGGGGGGAQCPPAPVSYAYGWQGMLKGVEVGNCRWVHVNFAHFLFDSVLFYFDLQ